MCWDASLYRFRAKENFTIFAIIFDLFHSDPVSVSIPGKLISLVFLGEKTKHFGRAKEEIAMETTKERELEEELHEALCRSIYETL